MQLVMIGSGRMGIKDGDRTANTMPACLLSSAGGKAGTTDQDGIVPALLATEITMRIYRDPGEIYRALPRKLSLPGERRIQAWATPKQTARLTRLFAHRVRHTEPAGEKIEWEPDRVPGHEIPIGGLDMFTKHSWLAAHRSGTENIYTIYTDRFRAENHLECIVREAQSIVDGALGMTRERATA